ncbi:MAG: GntR family transcriptional regulator [Treponema sp.]|nr:GntR family transcriptional regulator [Treponema sp.]
MTDIEKLPKESNRDYALRVIRKSLINLELKPGTMISEQDIADELKLSRTPVHEALQELSSTKIIEILPQRGSLVSYVDMALVDESVFMRATIESAVTKEACEKAVQSDLDELEENVTLQEFFYAKNNLDKFMELDNAFHKIMYKIANKMQCHFVVSTMNIHYDRFRQLRLHTSDPANIVADHKLILQAMIDKDSEKAKDLVLKHLNRLYTDEMEIRKKYPDYFVENSKK